jgi:ATP synthase in type III secretion protein N
MELDRALATVDRARPLGAVGRVTEVVGLVVRATVPGVRLGELVTLRGGALVAEVIAFKGEDAVLMPLGDPAGLGADDEVVPTGESFRIRVGERLLGRVLGGLGEPLDGRPLPDDLEPWAVDRAAPDPLTRARVVRPLVTGIRAVDAFATFGEGQRIGLFAGAGAGKSTLLGQLARSSDADVNVICLVGERGREVRDFLEDALGPEGLARSVVVCATSDAPALVRLKSLFVATAIAEWFRDRRGKRVLMLVDSLTRFARAQREVGLAAGEPPVRQGFPPSVFALLPRLVERTGAAAAGSITAVYTVLVAGGDLDEPIADEVRGVLDGHIVLDRELGARGRWPAIDVLGSLSRVMPAVTAAGHRNDANAARAVLATYERHRDLITLGAYRQGTDRRVDDAVRRWDGIEEFLRQSVDEASPWGVTLQQLKRLVS